MYFFVDYYVPDRYKEGYGISYTGIDWAEENGFTVIIALDCGIKAIEKVKYATEKGIDFIICDHHRPGDEIPAATAVLDPKRSDCPYPYKELSGCGIGFKLVQAIAMQKEIPFSKLYALLDLVAVSIAADIVPITDENRVLAYYGLKKLNKSPRPGLRSLIQINALNRQLTISDIVFIIAPRINAAGRMDDAREAVRLLISPEGKVAKKNADVLQERNHARKQVDADITEQALNLLIDNPDTASKKSTVLYNRNWHKGVIGIVASRLIEKFYKPTIILTHSNGVVAGSARSVSGFDIYNAIKACSDLLDQFGGHKYAAGLTLPEENVPAFIKRFETVVNETIEDHMLVPEIKIDAELPFRDFNPKFYKILRQFAPFGPGNRKPIFMSADLRDTGWSGIVGENHLRIYARQNGSHSVKGIGYNLGHFCEVVKSGNFDLCFSMEENHYNGNTSLQMNLRDVKSHKPNRLEDPSLIVSSQELDAH